MGNQHILLFDNFAKFKICFARLSDTISWSAGDRDHCLQMIFTFYFRTSLKLQIKISERKPW